MNKFLSIGIFVLTCGLFGSCDKSTPLDSPVGMNWETTLTYTPYQDIVLPAAEGVHDFTCNSHKVFSVEKVTADGTERTFTGVYSNRLHTISGPWYEIHIGANMMQVSVKANDTGEKRSLLVSIGAPGGGEDFQFVQDK